MINSLNAIEVRNVEKGFKVYFDKSSNLKEKVIFWKRNNHEFRKVLNGISFDVKKGEAIGLIGHNGCGKSTTLKLLTRIMYPDKGTIEINGRVSSLIELGAGFHPDMSGRENIYINASIFGLTRKEIDERIDDIISFSELQDFIENPVRTYSSGMYMRLAFSVAINVNADVLLIDEILAVGDVSFQAKCFEKLKQIKSRGTTIVIVSHSLGQIEQICDRSIWIHEGLIKKDGLPRIVDPLYLDFMSKKGNEKIDESIKSADKNNKNQQDESLGEKTEKEKKRWGSGEAKITSIAIKNKSNRKTYAFKSNEQCNIEIGYKANKKVKDAIFGIAIYKDDQTYIYGTNTLIDTAQTMLLQNNGKVIMDIKSLPLNSGTYSIDFAIHNPNGFEYDFWREAVTIKITNNHQEVGIISINHEWRML